MIFLFTWEAHFLEVLDAVERARRYAADDIFPDILKKDDKYTESNKCAPLCQTQVIGCASFG